MLSNAVSTLDLFKWYKLKVPVVQEDVRLPYRSDGVPEIRNVIVLKWVPAEVLVPPSELQPHIHRQLLFLLVLDLMKLGARGPTTSITCCRLTPSWTLTGSELSITGRSSMMYPCFKSFIRRSSAGEHRAVEIKENEIWRRNIGISVMSRNRVCQ